MTNARVAATRALLAVTEHRATLGSAIDAERRSIEDSRDRALALELVAGALRWQAALDRVIEDASGRSIDKIDRIALAVLRIGAYQLLYLERVPDHAVVSESVEAARVVGAARAAGFVNAVMRQVIRRRQTMRLPAEASAGDSRKAQLDYLSITLSHPAWLVERWLDRIGYEATRQWCKWNNTAPAVTVRAIDQTGAGDLVGELTALGFAAEPAPFVEDAVRLGPGVLGRLEPEVRARLWVQDEGAQLVARAAGVRPGERVLDLCASPGGKSLVFRQDLREAGRADGLLVAADHRRARVDLLARTLRRDHPGATIVRLDATQPLPFLATFDCVLVDVPCSGLGTIRRDPDVRWARRPEDFPSFVSTESEILRRAATAVRPGGRLVYATCSTEPEENDAVVESFLTEDSSFAAGGVGPRIPDSLKDDRGWLVTRPDRHGLDGFFAAVLVRQQAA